MKYRTENKLHVFDVTSIVLVVLFLVCTLLPFSGEAATIGRPVSNLGLVGHWSFDEGTSTIAHDLSGNGRHSSFSGAPEWVSGKKGKALDFDGVDDYVTTTANRGSYSAITASAWFRFEGSIGDSYRAIIAGQSADFFVGKNSGNSNIGVQDGSYNSAMAVGTNAWNGEWHHIAYTFSGGTGTIYLDGVSVGSGAFGGGSGVIWIGQENEGAGYDFNGKIDDVRLYSRALSPTEVSSLYGSTQATHVVANKRGLIGHWSFNEGVGTIAHDQSGLGNNLTLSNGPVWVNGKKGKALQFISASNTNAKNTTATIFNRVNGDELTVSAWIRPSWTSGYRDLVVNRSDATYNWMLYQHTTDGSIQLHGSAQYKSTYIPPNNVWTYIVATVDSGGNYNLYANGQVVQSSAYTYQNGAPTELSIGNFGTANEPYEGLIDDVRIYSRALIASEVSALYRSTEIVINQSQNNKLTNGLVGYWTFNGQDTLME